MERGPELAACWHAHARQAPFVVLPGALRERELELFYLKLIDDVTDALGKEIVVDDLMRNDSERKENKLKERSCSFVER